MKLTNLFKLFTIAAALLLVQGCMGGFGHRHHMDNHMEDKMFSRLDQDDNNYIEEDEYMKFYRKRFELSDDDDDGRLAKDEFQGDFPFFRK